VGARVEVEDAGGGLVEAPAVVDGECIEAIPCQREAEG
jgi:hypothetical protein